MNDLPNDNQQNGQSASNVFALVVKYTFMADWMNFLVRQLMCGPVVA
ncbi:hypothetical protein [Sphingorhabdus sp.]